MGDTPRGTIYNTTRVVKVLDEIDPVFDIEANVYLIVVDSNSIISNGP